MTHSNLNSQNNGYLINLNKFMVIYVPKDHLTDGYSNNLMMKKRIIQQKKI